MTGLILKDLLILRKSMRTYLLFIVIYGVLAITGAWAPAAAGGTMMVIVAMLPMNVFSYDKQAKWDTYGLALPVSRTKTVAARYACVLLLCLAGVIAEVVLGVVMAAMGRLDDFISYLITCAVCGLVALLMNAVLLPLLYKFEVERARIMLYVLLGIIVFLGWCFLFPGGGMEWLKSLDDLTTAEVAIFPVVAVLVGLVLLALSFLLSRAIYMRKEQ